MRRLVVVVLTVLAVVVSTAGSASAQTKVRQDPVGDGPRTADVRSLRVANGADRLVVTVKLQRVVKGRSAVLIGVSRELEGEEAPVLLVDVFPVAGGRFTTRALAFDPAEAPAVGPARLQCAEQGVEVRGGRGGTVRIAVDRDCIPRLSNRLETAAFAYDKRTLGFSYAQLILAFSTLRGDAPGADDVPDPEEAGDETSFVTTRRG